MRIARAVSILTVRLFNIHSLPGEPFFCGQGMYRQCDVAAVDNNRCGTPVGNPNSQAVCPLFTTLAVGTFDPCNTFEVVGPGPPHLFSDTTHSCRLTSGGFDCWDAVFTLSIPVTVQDMIAGCLANLALIDLNAVQFGMERRVVNNQGTGAAEFSDWLIGQTPGMDRCVSPGATELASSMSVRYGLGETAPCDDTGARRIIMRNRILTITASRSRFETNATWCARANAPILEQPDFVSSCNSVAGACSDAGCVHYNPATGIIEVPPENSCVHIGLCTNPAAPCNAIPIDFLP